MKRVQVTVEMTTSFISMLRAELNLNKTIGWLDAGKELTASQCLALAAYQEARGGLEHEIDGDIPHCWRPDFAVIHENRKVIDGQA